MSHSTAIVIGVGAERGLGAQICHRFARDGLHVFVAGRTLQKVELVASAIRELGGKATALAVDASNEGAVRALVAQAEAEGPVEVAVYNAGSNMPGDFLSMEASFFQECWRIACFGGFLFSREVLRHMEPRGKGSLLFTGASASLRGRPFFAAFTAAKAGLRALAQSLAREFGPKGVHVAHVVIDGAIDGDRINLGRPQVAAALGSDGMIDIAGIVDLFHMLHHQPRRAWTHELDVRTNKESF